MQSLLINFVVFTALGVTVEVLFTAISNFIISLKKGKPNYALMGHSYIWMFFIYGSIAFIFPYLYNNVSELNLFIRLLIYGIGILIAEFIFGYILEKITGRCPWHYEKGLHIRGLVRIDYLPLWMVFAYLVEKIYL